MCTSALTQRIYFRTLLVTAGTVASGSRSTRSAPGRDFEFEGQERADAEGERRREPLRRAPIRSSFLPQQSAQ